MLQVHDRSVDCGDHARPARGRFVEWGVPFLLLLLPVFAMQLTPGLLPGGPLMLVLTAFAIGTRAATDPPSGDSITTYGMCWVNRSRRNISQLRQESGWRVWHPVDSAARRRCHQPR
jgi:hypothetical protein